LSTAPLMNLAYVTSVKSSFILMSKQGHFSDIFTIIAIDKNLNLLAKVRHDVRPLMCLFIRVFAFLATGVAGIEPATKRLRKKLELNQNHMENLLFHSRSLYR